MNKYNITKGIVLCISAIFFLSAVQFAHAQGLKSAGQNLKSVGVKSGSSVNTDLPTLVGGIISAALTLVGIIFLILMVYAGYLWMTARGENEQVEKAKNIIQASIIGIVIVLSAYAITTFVTSKLSSF